VSDDLHYFMQKPRGQWFAKNIANRDDVLLERRSDSAHEEARRSDPAMSKSLKFVRCGLQRAKLSQPRSVAKRVS
jgi:hypothetical protein